MTDRWHLEDERRYGGYQDVGANDLKRKIDDRKDVGGKNDDRKATDIPL